MIRRGSLWIGVVIGIASTFSLAGCSSQDPSLPVANGFFQVAKAGDRWLLVTPAGEPFYSVGVNHITNNNNTDRETGICPYCEAIDSIYESPEAWA